MAHITLTAIRTTRPDWGSLLAAFLVIDPLIDAAPQFPVYQVTKPTAWTGPQIAAAQNALESAPETSARLTAQAEVDQLTIREKAIILTLLDELNRLRTQPTTTFVAITPAMAIAAVRTKAGTL
jgi:hypothetical protein